MVNIYEILQKIGFDWQVALANLFNFLIILFLLKQFAFKPIKKVIDERQIKINEGLENAKKAKTELMMANQNKEKIISDANVAAMAVLSEGAKVKNEIIEKAKLKARDEARKVLLDAQKNAKHEIDKIQRQFRQDSIDLVIDSTEKLLREKMTEDRDKKLIKSLLS